MASSQTVEEQQSHFGPHQKQQGQQKLFYNSNASKLPSPLATTAISMSAGEISFPEGSIAKLTTCAGETVQGEVVAYDTTTKFLMLKVGGGSGAKSQVSFINLNNCTWADVIVEAPAGVPPLAIPKADTTKINQKLEKEISRQKRAIVPSEATVSTEGQKLFLMIQRTMDEVWWETDGSIVVFDRVCVRRPYGVEDVVPRPAHAAGDNRLHPMLSHVKKIVEKHHKDSGVQQQRDSAAEQRISDRSPNRTASPPPPRTNGNGLPRKNS